MIFYKNVWITFLFSEKNIKKYFSEARLARKIFFDIFFCFLCRRVDGGSYLQNKCLCECEPPPAPRHIFIITHPTLSYNKRGKKAELPSPSQGEGFGGEVIKRKATISGGLSQTFICAENCFLALTWLV